MRQYLENEVEIIERAIESEKHYRDHLINQMEMSDQKILALQQRKLYLEGSIKYDS